MTATPTCFVFGRDDGSDMAILVAPDVASAWLALGRQVGGTPAALRDRWQVIDQFDCNNLQTAGAAARLPEQK